MLITPSYVKEQHRLHVDPSYGSGSHRHAYLVAGMALIEDCKTVLDYGAGKGTLGTVLRNAGLQVAEYDPGVPGKEQSPEPADLVTCLDVLEHIEPDCFNDVLADLARLTKKRLFVDVSTKFTKFRWLSDGRNSHLIVKDIPWWTGKFTKRGFRVLKEWNTGVAAWVALMQPPIKR
jgi:2-polyprenyl-3-methyl-5-hydroxy-6-metoxy-1,4-benzoquinol methylase